MKNVLFGLQSQRGMSILHGRWDAGVQGRAQSPTKIRAATTERLERQAVTLRQTVADQRTQLDRVTRQRDAALQQMVTPSQREARLLENYRQHLQQDVPHTLPPPEKENRN